METTNDIISGIIQREGSETDDPQDRGGRTKFGISERSNPEAWKDGPPTQQQARDIYLKKYVKGPGFDLVDEPLRSQLVDFGVTSGPMIAIGHLQEAVGTTPDGVLGPDTLQAIKVAGNVSNRLVASRIRMICQIVQRNPSQVKFLKGWVNRALEFLQ